MKAEIVIIALLANVSAAEQVQVFRMERKRESIPASQVIGCKVESRKDVSVVFYATKGEAIGEFDIDDSKIAKAMKTLPSDGENPLLGETDAFKLVGVDGRVLALVFREKEAGIVALSPAKEIGGGILVKTGESRVVEMPELQSVVNKGVSPE